ncbi:S24 family peptidase [Deinococcus sp. YIM 77859]|uniref:S24 family peptidase n=1 Tax=Deinococcus sp. YIM 77859 TaxID=1540221 RepID=UPI0012E05045|nr:S24 family peptidase [Deinococcus sp. YIM 77859]
MTRKQKDRPAWAQALVQRRTQLGKRQEDVAAAGGYDDEGKEVLTTSNVADVETGRVHLLNVGLGKAVALAKGLEWSWSEMQQATGIDLGIAGLSLAGEGSADVYPLAAALTPHRPGRPVDHEAVTPGIARPLLLRADTDEMVGTSPASIRPGSYLHVDLEKTTPEEGRVYVVTDNDGVHVRLYTPTRFGPAFRAENRAYEDIPAAEAHVVGLVAGVTSDYDPQMN